MRRCRPERWAAATLTVLFFVIVATGGAKAVADTTAGPTPATAPPPPATLPTCPAGSSCADGTSSPSSGLQDNLLGSCNQSATPDDHYDIMYSTGGGLFAKANVGRQVPGVLTNLTFTAVRWTVHAAQCLIDWALQFKLASGLRGAAGTLAGVYQTRIVGPLQLSSFCLFLCVVWCAYQILRGRTGRGLGEMAVSFVLAAMFAGVASQPAVFLLGPDGMMGRAQATAVELAGITASVNPNNSPGPPPGAGPVQQNGLLMAGFHRAFVEIPWQLLNWGAQLDSIASPAPKACLDAMDQIAQRGPWGTADTPRTMMGDAGCPQLASYNAEPSADRLVGSVIAFWGAEWVVVFALLLAVALSLAQFALVGCVIVFPFMVPLALLPGGGRQRLWKWVTTTLVAFATVLVSVMALSLLLVSVDAVVRIYEGQALLIIIGALDLLVVAVIIAWFRLRRSMRATARRLGESLHHMPVGGAGGNRWLAPTSAGEIALGAAGAYGLYRGYRRLRYATERATGNRRRPPPTRPNRPPSPPGPNNPPPLGPNSPPPGPNVDNPAPPGPNMGALPRAGASARPGVVRPGGSGAGRRDPEMVDEDEERFLQRSAAEADERNRRHVGQVRVGDRWVVGRSVSMEDLAGDGPVPGPRPSSRRPTNAGQARPPTSAGLAASDGDGLWPRRSLPADMDILRRLHAQRRTASKERR